MLDSESDGQRPSLKEDEKRPADVGCEIPTDAKNALIVRMHRPATTLTALFDETVEELTEAQLGLEIEAHKRLRRYKFTRIGVAFFMCLGVLATLGLNIQSIGLDTLATRVSPIIMTCGLFFYILEALLRDHEVSYECGRESNRLKSLIRRAKVDWISQKGSQDQAAAVKILNELNDGCMKLDLLMAAEKVPPIQEILRKLQGKKITSRRVQKSCRPCENGFGG